MLRSLDDAGVDVGVLLAPFLSEGFSLDDAASLRRANEHLARLVRGRSDRLAGFRGRRSARSAGAAAPAPRDRNARPRRREDGADRLVPYDADVQPVFAEARRLGIPLLFHSGIFIDGRSGRFCRPTFFEALRDHPGLKVCLAHLGWPWVDEAIDAPLVGFIGRLSAEKGPDLFLRAALSIRAQCPRAHFVLVGEGAMLTQLQLFVSRFAIADAVHFAGSQDDMPAVFNELDVVVSSSLSEAMPLAVMEAMASGVPVVACKVGGIPDLIEHGVTGWRAPESDYDELATRVVDLLHDDALRAAVGKAARARAVGRFALEQSVEATARLFAQLTAQRADPRRIGTLHEARPIRANGSAVKAAAAAAKR